MPDHLAPYADAIGAMTLLALILLAQGFVSAFFRNAVEKYQPGETLPPNHASATYRQVRSFENSLEAIPVFFIAAALAITLGVAPGWVWWATIITVIARALHWAFYSLNMPALRTAAFAVGSFAALSLGVAAALKAV